jgi:hypothetical protein
MERSTVKLIGFSFLLAVILSVAWLILPISGKRYADIKFGDHIVEKIEDYRKTKGLPETGDWETLRALGFKDKVDFLVPDYQKLNDDTYELRFIEGFDGPYLLWNSKDKVWKVDMPKFQDH